MKLITRDTDYAIRALLYIARSDQERVSTAELECALKLPRPFMRKIFPKLQKAGVLHSIKGFRGGFSLALSPKKIFLTDLIRIFQGPICFSDCLFKKKICPNLKQCLLRKKLQNIETLVNNELKSVCIASLME